MRKLSEMKIDEMVVVNNVVVESVEDVINNKEIYIGKEMYEAKEYKPGIDASEVLEWIEEDIQCNDDYVHEDWKLECSQKNKSDLQAILDKISKESSNSWVRGEKIENDLDKI